MSIAPLDPPVAVARRVEGAGGAQPSAPAPSTPSPILAAPSSLTIGAVNSVHAHIIVHGATWLDQFGEDREHVGREELSIELAIDLNVQGQATDCRIRCEIADQIGGDLDEPALWPAPALRAYSAVLAATLQHAETLGLFPPPRVESDSGGAA